MKKKRRINLRISDAHFRAVDRRATYAGLTVTEYLRAIIGQDISTNTDAVIRRLARMIVFSSVSIRHLYKVMGHEEEMHAVNEEVKKLLSDLGLSDE